MSFADWKDKRTGFRRIDVRGVAGNFFPGLKKQAMELPGGAGLEVVQTFEPIPLYAVMEQLGLNGNAVNPRVLMPRIGKELALSLTGITLENKGVRYDLLAQRTLPAGSYRVYRQRQSVAIPYKTRVVVNGIVADEISYDQLIQNGVSVYAVGRKNYPKETLYPDERLQLLGEATLTPGKNTLGIALTDILGAVTATSYALTIY